MDSRNLLFIAGGAFFGLEKISQERMDKTANGFDVTLGKKTDERNIFEQTLPHDLLKYGLIPELIGRMPVLCTLHELSEEALIDILVKPKNAICSQYKKYFEMDGVELSFEDKALRAIASIAIKQQAGARGLRSIMEKFMLKIMYSIPDLEKVKSCVITEEVVNNLAEPAYGLIEPVSTRKKASSSS